MGSVPDPSKKYDKKNASKDNDNNIKQQLLWICFQINNN